MEPSQSTQTLSTEEINNTETSNSDYTKTTTNPTTTRKKKSRFFETYISKVLKQVSPENGITANSKQQLNSVICTITKQISQWALKLTQISKKKTLSEKEVANAVKIIFPGELCTNSIMEGDQSISKFSNQDSKNSSRQNKAGIIFPPSIAEKFLREFGFTKIMITKHAPVYLAAVLEYITQDILQLASYMAKDNKRVRITVRDLELSVNTDSELSTLFRRCKIKFIGGGVIPYIHQSLLMKKPRKKKKAPPPHPTIKRPHRFRPGTVALRDIRKYQKISNCLIFAKHPFERYIRQIISSQTSKPMKISKDVFIVLQYYIEQYIIKFLRDANAAAIHCNRVKLMPVDIQFICNLRNYDLEEKEDEEPTEPTEPTEPIDPSTEPNITVVNNDMESV